MTFEEIPKQAETWGAWPPEALGALGVSGSRFSVERIQTGRGESLL